MAPPTPGRNDPCPCGSGKKYKKCHGLAVDAGYSRDDVDQAVSHLSDWFDRPEIRRLMTAVGPVWTPPRDEAEQQALTALVEKYPEGLNGGMFCFFAFDMPLPDGREGVARLVLDRDAQKLGVGVRTFLREMLERPWSLYEALDVRPGQGLTLRDVATGEVVDVVERLGSTNVPSGTLLGMRLAGTPRLIEGGILPFPALWRDRALAHFAEVWAEREIIGRAEVTRQMFRLWVQLALNPPVPTLANTDGEVLLPTCVRWPVLDAEAVRAALNALPLQTDEPDAWSWMKDDTLLGAFILADGTLTLETNSVERAKRGQAMLEPVAGAALGPAETESKPYDLREAARGAVSAEGGRSLEGPEAQAAITELLTTHYRRWLDEPVPALDGLTPREAARRPTMRTRLEGLLRDIDAQSQRERQTGHSDFDSTFLWTELGLGR